MNRTALCIRMLLLLRSRGMMNSKELAAELETNPRNIREFRAELEVAGYNINEKKGRYGGYKLDESALFPSLDLNETERRALEESRQLIRTHGEFALRKEYESALDKISSGVQNFEYEKKYLYPVTLPIDPLEQQFIDVAGKAINNSRRLQMSYQSLEAQEAEAYEIDPYEILHYQHAYYLVAYSHKRNAFRTYRFSKERMRKLEMAETGFLRDKNFHLDSMIGEHTIFKGQLIQYVIKIHSQTKALFLERPWGSHLNRIGKEGDWEIYSFYSDEKILIRQQLFALGNHAVVLQPQSFVHEYSQYLKSILGNYGKE